MNFETLHIYICTYIYIYICTSFYISIYIHLYIYMVFQILGGVSTNFWHHIYFVLNLGIRDEHDSSCIFRCENESLWWTWEFVALHIEFVMNMCSNCTYIEFVTLTLHMYISWRMCALTARIRMRLHDVTYMGCDGYESSWRFSCSTWWICALTARTCLLRSGSGWGCVGGGGGSHDLLHCVAGCCMVLQCGAAGCCVSQFF